MNAAAFWDLTPREYYVLSDIAESEARRWAIAQSLQLNMNLPSGSVPFIADDFLGLRDRDKIVREKKASDLKVARMNQQLSMMVRQPLRKGQPEPDGLPLWARKAPPKDAIPTDGSVRKDNLI